MSKSRIKLAEDLIRATKRYVRASKAYNLDCNTRLNVKAGDSRRNALFWKNNDAFHEMVNLIEKIR